MNIHQDVDSKQPWKAVFPKDLQTSKLNPELCCGVFTSPTVTSNFILIPTTRKATKNEIIQDLYIC